MTLAERSGGEGSSARTRTERRLRRLLSSTRVLTPPRRASIPRDASVGAWLSFDEVTRAEILERLLDLRARVHHERTVARDRLSQRARGGEQETAAGGAGGRFDHVTIAEHDKCGRAHDLLAEARLAVIHVGECGVAARHRLAKRRAGRQHDA